MPDLSNRPTRYAITLVSAAALLTAAFRYDVRFGADPDVELLRAERGELQEQLQSAARDQVREESERAARAAVAAAAATATTTAPATTVPEATTTTTRRPTVTARLVVQRPKAGCASYADRERAQAAFDADRAGMAQLDGDADGIACEQLKVSTVPVVAPPPLPVAPSKAEIVASAMHFGLATSTVEELESLQVRLGRDTSLYGYFKGWDTDFDQKRVIDSWRRGQVPMMTWESRPLTGAPDEGYALKNIIDGQFDAYLVRYARAIKTLGLPLVIRFDQEMNGNWYRWTEFESTLNSRGEYVQAWKHVHDIFAAEKANDLVVWTWSPNRVDNIKRYPAMDNYYPGAAYVDWVGMTGYFRPGDGLATFSSTYDRTLAELRRVAPGKPIVLAEVGATEDGGQKLAWMKTFVPGLLANPDVIGFVWLNLAVTDAGNTNDWRLDSGPKVFEAFRLSLKDSGFGRDHGKRLTLVPAAGGSVTLPWTTSTTSSPSSTTSTSTTSTSTTSTSTTSTTTMRATTMRATTTTTTRARTTRARTTRARTTTAPTTTTTRTP